MYDPDAAYDLAWAPVMYPSMKPDDDGAWATVLNNSDDPIGIVWTNYTDAAGVLWISQEPSVEALYKHFHEGAQAGTPAGYAYNAASLVSGVKLGAEFSGPLTGALEELSAIADD